MLLQGLKVLVTGGTGFIGSHLVSRILEEGAEVTVLTRRDRESGDVNFIKGEITDPKVLTKATKDIDTVFHLAGYVDVSGAICNPLLDFQTNVAGTFYLLEAARNNDVGKFIYISSARVYGDPQYAPQDENHPLIPKEFYGASKLIGEIYCRVFGRNYGLRTVIIRPFSVYGEGQLSREGSLSGVVSIFVKNVLEGRDLLITGDGTQTKDFVYVSDLVDALVSASVNDESVGDVFNIGYGEAVSIKRLAELVIHKTGADVGIRHIPQTSENVNNHADISKAKSILRYSPKISLEEGLDRYIRWYRKEIELKLGCR